MPAFHPRRTRVRLRGAGLEMRTFCTQNPSALSCGKCSVFWHIMPALHPRRTRVRLRDEGLVFYPLYIQNPSDLSYCECYKFIDEFKKYCTGHPMCCFLGKNTFYLQQTENNRKIALSGIFIKSERLEKHGEKEKGRKGIYSG